MMADNPVYDFGLRIKQLRQRKSWTQKELGDRLHVTKEAISHYENNTQTPGLANVVRLAVLLNTSADYLLGLEDEPVIKISDLADEKKQFVMDFIKLFVDEKAD